MLSPVLLKATREFNCPIANEILEEFIAHFDVGLLQQLSAAILNRDTTAGAALLGSLPAEVHRLKILVMRKEEVEGDDDDAEPDQGSAGAAAAMYKPENEDCAEQLIDLLTVLIM